MHAAPSTKATSPLGCLMTAMMLALAGFAPLTTHSEEATKEADPEAFSGDVGLGVLHGAGGIQGVRARTSLEPYLNFEKGRLFARIDSFGVKTLPLGMGHLELLGQVRSDGYKGGGWAQRKDPVPLGLGTLQITPIGAFGIGFAGCGWTGRCDHARGSCGRVAGPAPPRARSAQRWRAPPGAGPAAAGPGSVLAAAVGSADGFVAEPAGAPVAAPVARAACCSPGPGPAGAPGRRGCSPLAGATACAPRQRPACAVPRSRRGGSTRPSRGRRCRPVAPPRARPAPALATSPAGRSVGWPGRGAGPGPC